MFTPHLMPMTRGILSTIYTTLKKEISEDEIRQMLIDKYKDEYFVKVLDKGVMPHTKWVYGSNFCHINVVLDEDTGNLVILSAIDNLVKGASGQAIQNMNILFGIEEKKGIENFPLFP
jgi:N-acetyl-gamma-glutamyl-phosphate reductase